MNIVIKTLGCKANRYESDRITDHFEGRFNIADAQNHSFKSAGIIIVNTCTVTHVADRKSRQAISHLKSLFPEAKVLVFGCGANVAKEDYQALDYVDYVVKEFEELCKIVEELDDGVEIDKDTTFAPNRTRALIKIQDGCNNFCSYCIIPFARGAEDSRPLKAILDEISSKVDKGFKEVVLTGINIGQWKENSLDLADMIEQILLQTAIERLRLSSIEPQNFNAKFTELFKNPRFCPHLHISLQSGSDDVLKAMYRRYDTAFFTKMVEDLRSVVPHISITTDVIVGFPGETEELFEETCDFVRELEFSKIHIFPYSKRHGTKAADFPDQVPFEIKKDRCARLSHIEKNLRKTFYLSNIGRKDSLLIEMLDEAGNGIGFTSNYLKTRIKGGIANSIIDVELSQITDKCEISGKAL